MQRECFITKAEALRNKGEGIVELTVKKPVRTMAQNKYLHVILSYFALETGETMEYVKDKYFKILCNRDMFVKDVDDKYLGRIKVLRSTSELDTGEMTTAIERFRNFAASEGCYIPSPDEHLMIQQMECELSRNRQWI